MLLYPRITCSISIYVDLFSLIWAQEVWNVSLWAYLRLFVEPDYHVCRPGQVLDNSKLIVLKILASRQLQLSLKSSIRFNVLSVALLMKRFLYFVFFCFERVSILELSKLPVIWIDYISYERWKRSNHTILQRSSGQQKYMISLEHDWICENELVIFKKYTN